MCMVFIIMNEKIDDSLSIRSVSRDPAMLSLFWSIAFCSCLVLTYEITGGALNPAIAFSINLTMAFNSESKAMLYVWIYLVFPILGSLLAVIFYKFVYLKTKL